MAVPVKRKLSEKQTALVDTLVSEGCSVQEAAEKAGYSSGESARTSGHRALALPHVQQYMHEKMLETFGLSATGALATVSRLSRNAKSEYVQLEASKDLLDRAGYKPIDRSQVQVAGDIKVSIDLG